MPSVQFSRLADFVRLAIRDEFHNWLAETGSVADCDPAARLCQLLEWIEDFEPRPFEVPVVPRGDREAVPTCGCRDVAVFDRHALTCLVEQSFLLRPHVGDRHIEPMDASVQRD